MPKNQIEVRLEDLVRTIDAELNSARSNLKNDPEIESKRREEVKVFGMKMSDLSPVSEW